jgi:hypothetical protein
VRTGIAGLCLVVVISACSDGSGSSKATTTTRRSPAPSRAPAPSGSPAADITFRGDAGIAGTATNTTARCNWPDLDGIGIAVLATPFDARSLARVALDPGRVEVILGSGSGSDYHERAFEGTGVTSFDAARGARIDSSLTETAATSGTTKGDIGVLTAITGSVDCGNQTAGNSTVTITGPTADGALTGATLDPGRVECDETSEGTEVVGSGLVTIGTRKAHVVIGLTSGGDVTLDVATSARSYRYAGTGGSSISPTGAHVRTNVVEKGGAAPARTLDLEGDLTCGLNASG